MAESKTIILIGPMCAGKSTIAKHLAERLQKGRCSLDEIRNRYYDEIGFDHARAIAIAKSEAGMPGLLKYWKPFEVSWLIAAVLGKVGSMLYNLPSLTSFTGGVSELSISPRYRAR